MKLLLISWTIAAFVWWLIALYLLARSRRRTPLPAPEKRAPISVFKPLPPVRDELECAAFSTAGNVAIVTLNGRALSLGASVTLVDTVINVPGN